MIVGRLGVKLPTDRQLYREFAKILAQRLTEVFRAVAPVIKTELAPLIERAIKNSPEYDSLLHGRLYGELGLANPAEAMKQVIQAIQQSMQVTATPVTLRGNDFDGSLTISMLRTDFADVLSTSLASYDSKGGRVDWLEWLLTSGETVVLAHYFYLPGDEFDEWSRTGEGIMGKSKVMVRGWRVPAEFVGYPDDNFLTRSLTSILPDIGLIVHAEIARRF